jgi:hypothetical protein
MRKAMMSKPKKQLSIPKMHVPTKPIVLVHVPVYIKLTIFVDTSHNQEETKKELLRVFSNEIFPDGTKGFFHPNNFSSGQSLFQSQLVNTVLNVNGVITVEVDAFERVNKRGDKGRTNDLIKIKPNEVIQLSNNPLSPENGTIEFHLKRTNNF